MNHRRRFATLLRILTVLLAVAGPHPAAAQPLRDRIIDDVSITGRCLNVGFSFPLQYVRHFPFDAGSVLRIRFRAGISGGRVDGESLFKREVVRPPRRGALNIVDVTFEGDVANGPYLTIAFDQEVRFKVAQGRDFRSFVIAVLEDEFVPPCFPEP